MLTRLLVLSGIVLAWYGALAQGDLWFALAALAVAGCVLRGAAGR